MMTREETSSVSGPWFLSLSAKSTCWHRMSPALRGVLEPFQQPLLPMHARDGADLGETLGHVLLPAVAGELVVPVAAFMYRTKQHVRVLSAPPPDAAEAMRQDGTSGRSGWTSRVPRCPGGCRRRSRSCPFCTRTGRRPGAAPGPVVLRSAGVGGEVAVLVLRAAGERHCQRGRRLVGPGW